MTSRTITLAALSLSALTGLADAADVTCRTYADRTRRDDGTTFHTEDTGASSTTRAMCGAKCVGGPAIRSGAATKAPPRRPLGSHGPRRPPQPRTGVDAFQGRVVEVTDGDTITVLHNRCPVRVRLHGDAPETG
jgi:endonuclease YncB( thermonuclease family)